MNISQKVAQLLMVSFQGTESDTAQPFLELGVGHIIYYANNVQSPEQVKALSAALQSKSVVPLHIVVDQEGGRVLRFKGEGFTPFPSARSVAEEKIVGRTARKKSVEMRAAGITMNLGPVADVDTNPDNPVIGNRSFGREPKVVIPCCLKEIKMAHKEGIQTCIKHYPGHGDTAQDSHYALPTVSKTIEQLEHNELPPFEALLAVTDAIMTAHVMYPDIDPDYCATLSSRILQDLRQRFKGLIISDSLTMQGVLAQTGGSVVQAAIKAFNAGCDVLCVAGPRLDPQVVWDVHAGLSRAVEQGVISEERLNESVERITRSKEKIVPFPPAF